MSVPPALAARLRVDLERLAPMPDRIGVAVSGGPDSLALLLLAAAAFPGEVEAATVDHGLRPESAAEAAFAGRVAAGLGVRHAVLGAKVEARGEGLQAAAREARYAALAGWMGARGISTLLTAHHADDQAETLIMRLLRGSGLAGLAGIRPALPFPAAGAEARLCRPLLGWRRAELAAVVDAAGLEPVQDPSNADDAYDRARIRRHLAQTRWLDPAALARSASALAEAEEALECVADRLFSERTDEIGGKISLDTEGLPPELVRRLVLRALRSVASDAAPRGAALASFINRLRDGGTATLGGVKGTGGARFLFEPAPPRRTVRRAEPPR